MEASRGAVTGLGIDMMVARSFARGHLIEYRDGRWVYQDTQGSAETGRFCVRCGLKPTQEGYDACIGFYLIQYQPVVDMVLNDRLL